MSSPCKGCGAPKCASYDPCQCCGKCRNCGWAHQALAPTVNPDPVYPFGPVYPFQPAPTILPNYPPTVMPYWDVLPRTTCCAPGLLPGNTFTTVVGGIQ